MITEKLFKDKRSKDYRQFKKWVKALRSGKYKQTKRRLQDNKGYCCLGVACKVLIPQEKQDIVNGFLCGEFPDDQSNSPIWISKIIDDFEERTGRFIPELNDNGVLTFDEISDCLEAVYVHEVLE